MVLGARQLANRGLGDFAGNAVIPILTISDSDSAAGSDSVVLLVGTSDSDFATGNDSAFGFLWSDSDSGTGADTIVLPLRILPSPETGVGADTDTITAFYQESDSNQGSSDRGYITVVPYVPPDPVVGPPIPSAERGLVRWRFDDPLTGANYTFSVNPNSGGSTQLKKTVNASPTTAPDGKILVSEALYHTRDPSSWSGALYDQSQYDAFITWVEKPYAIQLTDDLGRTRMIILSSFQPKRERNPARPWKHSYTINYYLFEIEETVGVGLP